MVKTVAAMWTNSPIWDAVTGRQSGETCGHAHQTPAETGYALTIRA